MGITTAVVALVASLPIVVSNSNGNQELARRLEIFDNEDCRTLQLDSISSFCSCFDGAVEAVTGPGTDLPDSFTAPKACRKEFKRELKFLKKEACKKTKTGKIYKKTVVCMEKMKPESTCLSLVAPFLYIVEGGDIGEAISEEISKAEDVGKVEGLEGNGESLVGGRTSSSGFTVGGLPCCVASSIPTCENGEAKCCPLGQWGCPSDREGYYLCEGNDEDMFLGVMESTPVCREPEALPTGRTGGSGIKAPCCEVLLMPGGNTVPPCPGNSEPICCPDYDWSCGDCGGSPLNGAQLGVKCPETGSGRSSGSLGRSIPSEKPPGCCDMLFRPGRYGNEACLHGDPICCPNTSRWGCPVEAAVSVRDFRYKCGEEEIAFGGAAVMEVCPPERQCDPLPVDCPGKGRVYPDPYLGCEYPCELTP